MAIRYSEALPDDLRHEPVPKWVRAEAGGEVVIDTHEPVLIWEPSRIVPIYAIPREDVREEFLAADPEPEGEHHTATIAETFALEAGGTRDEHAAWRYSDEDLDGLIAFRFDPFDRWLEEEEEIVAHPRDPFKRIDVRRSSRHVVVSIDGEVVAETRRPRLLFETGLPVRFYMPVEDARDDLLERSATRTQCAYKGTASHWSARVGDELQEDIAWSYPEPLPDIPQIEGLICFYNERVDISVDGEHLDRPQTEWSMAA
jgi:uncharacterized protein (DUF427 family)